MGAVDPDTHRISLAGLFDSGILNFLFQGSFATLYSQK